MHPGYGNDLRGDQPNHRLAESNIYYDARAGAAIDGWTNPDFDASLWPRALDHGGAGAPPWNALVARPIPFFRFSELQPYTSVLAGPVAGGTRTIVARLPSNLQVTPSLTVDAPAGAEIGIQTDYYRDGGSEPSVRSTYVTRGGLQTFESLGWMSGTAVHYTVPSNVRVVSLAYRESGYDARFAGSFVSGNAFIDRLWQMSARTLYVTMRDNYMDCPTRERAQFWADAANEIRAGAYAFDGSVRALSGKAIRELVGWRRPSGVMIGPVPAGNWNLELPQQQLAGIWAAWRQYVQSGDSSWVADALAPFITHLERYRIGPDGLVVHWTGEWDWQDWGDNIDVTLLDNAWYAMAAQAVADLARVTGNRTEQARWTAKRDTIAAGFERLWNGARGEYRSPGFTGDTDDRGNALAVVAGLVPPGRYSSVTTVLQRHLNSTPYMEFYALEALYIMGAPRAALDRMRTRYSDQVEAPNPEYTLREFWDPKEIGSRNHGWAAGPLYVLSAYAAGVRPTAAGFTRFEFRPQLGWLTQLRAAIPIFGDSILVAVDRRGAEFTMRLTSPQGTRGRIAVPIENIDAPRILVNGVEVFAGGHSTTPVPGLTFVGEDETSILFDADPGNWEIRRIGVSARRDPPSPHPVQPLTRPNPRPPTPPTSRTETQR
jgi:hypothetical protein